MLTIRPFASDDDYTTLEQLDRRIWPDEYETVEEHKHADEIMEDHFNRRILAFLGDEPVGFGSVRYPFWWNDPTNYIVNGGVVPERLGQGIGHALFTALCDLIAPLEPQSLMAFTQENRTRAVRFLTDRGFTVSMREPRSALNVATFDRTRFAATEEAVARAGITIVPLTELAERDPDYPRKLWEIRWPIRQDIPSTEERRRETVDEFVSLFLSGPSFMADGYFVALAADGSYIGFSSLENSAGDPTKLYTRVTGVLREWRRRGVATALKLRAIDFAREYGAELIETDNEENNPMYGLNLALGFEPLPAWVTFKRPWQMPTDD